MSKLHINAVDGKFTVLLVQDALKPGDEAISTALHPQAISIDLGDGDGTIALAFPARDCVVNVAGRPTVDQVEDTLVASKLGAIVELREAFAAMPDGAKVPDGVGAWLQPLVNAIVEVLK